MDMEKVIKGLEICTSKPCYCTDCPYKANCCLDSQEVMEDALDLIHDLQSQIAMLVVAQHELCEMMKEQRCTTITEPDCRICGQSHCKYYHETRKPTECKSYIRMESR